MKASKIEVISIEEMIQTVEDYIYVKKGVTVDINWIEFPNIGFMKRQHALLCEAYGIADAYFKQVENESN